MEFERLPLITQHTAESLQLKKIAGELETIRVLLAELIQMLKTQEEK